MALRVLELLQLCLLISVVPAQYWLSRNPHVIRQALDWFESWCDALEDCLKDCFFMLWYMFFEEQEGAGEEDESAAREVLELRHQKLAGMFASSTHQRNVRSPLIKYHIGQVVRHSKQGYIGVIVGWDDHMIATKDWPRNKEIENQPNYLVMVDTHYRPLPQFTYVPQDDIVTIHNERIKHPSLDSYFVDFNGTSYKPRLWLHVRYPLDRI